MCSERCAQSQSGRGASTPVQHGLGAKNKPISLSYFSLPKTLTLVLLLLCQRIKAFNLDLNTVLVHRGPTDTYYGFSVAQHKDRGESWLLVGAPLAQGPQPQVIKGGAVYRCRSDAVNTCQQISFDEKAPGLVTINGSQIPTETKSYQWFGATVASSGESGKIVACAPRYVFHSSNYRRRDPVGMCYASTGAFHGIIPLEPCKRSDEWGYHRLGSCQLGYSASITQDGHRLFLGAVGSYYWQGQVYSYNFDNVNDYVHTRESPETNDDSYLGYSMALGRFSGGTQMDIAVGMPKGNNLTGQVVIYTQALGHVFNVTGQQLGSYFGFSLAAVDINGDGLDDVIIGAPFFTPVNEKETGYEQGAIYVAQQYEKGRFRIELRIEGKKSRGRFGTATTNAGDLNRDGYQDVVVGAPYDGENGRGAIYVFNGGSKGLKAKYSQAIFAEDIKEPGLRTFGYSLSGGMDMDKNQYPDLLIGAYASDRAIFLRSRPVVNVRASLQLQPKVITMDSKGCGLTDGTKVPCVLVTLCFNFTGLNVKPKLAFVYEIRIDKQSTTGPRAFILNNVEKNVHSEHMELQQGSEKCPEFYIYLMNSLKDKLLPIDVEVEYNIFDPFHDRRNVKPVLNKQISNTLKDQIEIKKNCGDDNVCIPDLRLTVESNVTEFVHGGPEGISLDIFIENRGEDAFETQLFLFLPRDVHFVKINKTQTDFPVVCSGANLEKQGSNDLVCDIANPFPANKTLKFSALFEPADVASASRDLTFIFQVNSSNAEKNDTLENNRFPIGMPVVVRVNLTTRQWSTPEIVPYNVTEQRSSVKSSELDIGPEIHHAYVLHNSGPSKILAADVTILWPMRTLDNKDLLYLMDQPSVLSKPEGIASCETLTLDAVNPRRIPLRKPQIDPLANSTINLMWSSHHNLDAFHSIGELTGLNRNKRHYKEFEVDSEHDSSKDVMSCGPTMCIRIGCKITNMAVGNEAYFILRSRLWRDTVPAIGLSKFQISSKLVSRITKLQFQFDPSSLPPKVAVVSTQVQLIGLEKPSPLSFWIILLAILGGLLLLGLLVLLLWKLGFFNRKRPPTNYKETEPLNPSENGYNYRKGDTAL